MTFEGLMFSTAIGGTVGVFIGIFFQRFKVRRQDPDSPAYQKSADFISRIFRFLTKSIYAVLAVGIIWTLYFMVIGLVDKRQTEYAANAATLIVSVVTIFSIMIAYYEFMRRGNNK